MHASFTVSDETVRAAGDLARELGTVLHVHVAEDRADVEDAQRRGYAGPLERLAALGALVPGSILAHGVHLTRSQVETAAAASCWLVQNPRSNEGNRVGYARNLRYAAKVALGSDGWDGDMAEEQVALLRLAKAHGDDRAAQRLAAGNALIAERFGAVADFVVRENGRVRDVIVGGRVAVKDGRLAGGDMEAIAAEARECASRLWSRMQTEETAWHA